MLTPDDLNIADVYETMYDTKMQEDGADEDPVEATDGRKPGGADGFSSQKCKMEFAGLIGGDYAATRGRVKSPKMLSEPAIAKVQKVEGYATFVRLLLEASDVTVQTDDRVVLSQDTMQCSASSSDMIPRRGRGRVMKAHSRSYMLNVYCDHLFCWLVMMTVSLADVLCGGECKNKAEDRARVRNAAQLPVKLVYLSLLFRANTQSSGCRLQS